MRTSIVLALLLSAFAAYGAPDGTLSLSPAVVMLRGDYGQSTTQTLTLLNGTSRAFTFELIAQDVVTRDGKRTFAEAGTLPGSIAATAVFSQKQVQVAPGESVSVTMTVTLPPSTPQRGVIALFRGTNTVMSGNVPMTASLGSLLTFTVSDAVEMKTTALSVRPQSATTNLGVTQACTNAGSEPLVAKGVLAVLDAKGSLVGKSAFTPHRLMPGESAELGGEFAGELEPGKYRVFVTYDYEGKTLSQSADVEIR
ncbi:MAG: Fn3-like domain-containing protein [Thermoanaerobaculia bacterium]